MELQIEHSLYFSNKQSVSLHSVARSLLATDAIVSRLPRVLEKAFPGLRVPHYDLTVTHLEEGSLITDYIFKIVCEHQQDLENAISKLGERNGISILERNPKIISMLIILIALFGAGYAVHSIWGKEAKPTVNIVGNQNTVISLLSEDTGLTSDEIKKIISEVLSGRERTRVQRDAVNLLSPGKEEKGVEVRTGETVLVTPEAMVEVPDVNLFEELSGEEYTRHFERTLIDVRVFDIDKRESGWKALLPDVGGKKRIKLTITPDIDIQFLREHSKFRGDVIVEFRVGADGESKPMVAHLYKLHRAE